MWYYGGMDEGELGLLSSDRLLGLMGDVIVQRNRADARIVALLGYVDRRGVVAEKGYGTAAALYVGVARASVGAAKRIAEQARTLHGCVTLTGERVPGVLPHVATAFAEGAISEEHVEKIQRFQHSLPADIDPAMWDIAETHLADAARDSTPRGLTRDINELRALIDPDGQEPTDPRAGEPGPRTTPDLARQDTVVQGPRRPRNRAQTRSRAEPAGETTAQHRRRVSGPAAGRRTAG